VLLVSLSRAKAPRLEAGLALEAEPKVGQRGYPRTARPTEIDDAQVGGASLDSNELADMLATSPAHTASHAYAQPSEQTATGSAAPGYSGLSAPPQWH
jgi:hypothetical protein